MESEELNKITLTLTVPDSYVIREIKSAETTGSGEAKLHVGATTNESSLDELFLNKNIYLKREEIINYLEESRLAYQCQIFGKYRECNFDYWQEKLDEAKKLDEEIIILKFPEKFISGNRYYIRLEDDFFKKYFRGIILPLITELKIRNINKNGENYVYITPLIKAEITELLKIREVDSSERLENYRKVFIGYEPKDISYNFDEEDLNELNDIKTDMEILKKLSKHKNSYQKIVYGAPGTGKSYSLDRDVKNSFNDIAIENFLVSEESIENRNYWAVGALWDGENKLDTFIKDKCWINGYADKYLDAVKKIKENDFIAIKASYTKGTKGNKIAVLEVRALGVVTKNYNDGKKVDVDWKIVGKIEKYDNLSLMLTIHNVKDNKYLEIFDPLKKLMEEKSEKIKSIEIIPAVERVTFYDGYTYGQFVGAYKPVPITDESGESNDISYEYVPGPMIRLLQKAYNYPNENFVLIIEEINRARADRVFGNIFQLLDRDKTGKSEYPISLSEEQNNYLKSNLDREIFLNTIGKEGGLYLPSNFYIWATMNSADQGVYPMDSAFKRRWNFEYIGLDKNAENFGDAESTYYIPLYKTGGISEKGNISHEVVEWNDFRKIINNTLLHEVRVPEDRLLAPFFVKPENFEYKDPEHDKDLWIDEEIFKSKILMYLFDDILRHRGKDKIFSSNIRSFSELIATYEEGKNIFNEEITEQLLKEEEPKEQV